MRRAAQFALSLTLLTAGSALAQGTTSKVLAAALGPDECAVWARELSFAQSVADHDAAAFASHVHADAAFGAGRPAPIRGRDAITRRWGGIIEGKTVALAWYPSRVTIGGTGDVAWSSGPALFEDLASGAKERYSLGGFHSVWHRDSDGVWRVLFDDGMEPKPATPADVAAFRAGRQPVCPKA
jgi:ketosteroid isomerase-like protein